LRAANFAQPEPKSAGAIVSRGRTSEGSGGRASIARLGANTLHEIDEEEGIDFDQK
jgi:hypothetical protein